MGRTECTLRDGLENWEHWYAGNSLPPLERTVGVARHARRKYIALAEAAGYAPPRPCLTRAPWEALCRQTFPQRTPCDQYPCFRHGPRYHLTFISTIFCAAS